MGPKLQVTKNYDLFELHELNRPLHKDKRLEESMKKYGFMPSCPIQCVHNGNGKLKIIKGHHRFMTAKNLGLNVWYIVDKTNTDLFYMESCRTQWTVNDFANARANAGDEHCKKLLVFMENHGLNIGSASSLLGGESAGSLNKVNQIKRGTFKVVDSKLTNMVIKITDRCRDLKIPFATNSAFVGAISFVVRIPEFDINLFIHKLNLHWSKMSKRTTIYDYLEEIEELYNYGQRQTRIPLAFRAKELARKRQTLPFGG